MTFGLSPEQQTALERYLRATYRFGWVLDGLWMALVAAGERPAAMVHDTVSSSERFTRADFDRLFEVFDFSRRSSADTEWYICREESRLEDLPSETLRSDEYHVHLGRFLGYPDRAVASFIRESTDMRTYPLPDILRGEFSIDDVAYRTFQPYVRRPNQHGLQLEIEEGKQTAECLANLAKRWGIPLLDQMATTAYLIERSEIERDLHDHQ